MWSTPMGNFNPTPRYTKGNIEFFLRQFEKDYDPQNPLANQHAGKLLGRGISAQVMEPLSFLHSTAVKRIIHELPDVASAERVCAYSSGQHAAPDHGRNPISATHVLSRTGSTARKNGHLWCAKEV